MNSKKTSSFNDGFLYVFYQKDEKNSFSAKKNISSKNDMILKNSLFFKYESIRKEDFLFASNNGRKLTLKVKTQLVNGIDSSDKVMIGNTLFDIITIDPDTFNKELYFYLEEVRTIEGWNRRKTKRI